MTSPLAWFTTNGTESSSFSPLAFCLALRPTHCQFGPQPARAETKHCAVVLEKSELQRILRRDQGGPGLGSQRGGGHEDGGDKAPSACAFTAGSSMGIRVTGRGGEFNANHGRFDYVRKAGRDKPVLNPKSRKGWFWGRN